MPGGDCGMMRFGFSGGMVDRSDLVSLPGAGGGNWPPPARVPHSQPIAIFLTRLRAFLYFAQLVREAAGRIKAHLC
jgi:hypothetical protein